MCVCVPGTTFLPHTRSTLCNAVGGTRKLLQAIRTALCSTRVLQALVQVQRLDSVDIENVVKVFNCLLHSKEPLQEPRQKQVGSCQRHLCCTLLCLTPFAPTPQSIQLLRSFLVSTTAKDVSLMIGMHNGAAKASASSRVRYVVFASPPPSSRFDHSSHGPCLSPAATVSMLWMWTPSLCVEYHTTRRWIERWRATTSTLLVWSHGSSCCPVAHTHTRTVRADASFNRHSSRDPG